MNPGLSQNPLNHSFMSASLFNETQRRFLMRKHLCVQREGEVWWNQQKETRKEQLRVCRGKTCANGGCVGMLSSSFEK